MSVKNNKLNRYSSLDALRGIAIVSMIIYHAVWDLVYIFGVNLPWYRSKGAFIWQQSILWTFVLLSGFCWSLGKKNLKRAMTVLCCSAVITLVTAVFMPENLILFGVLSLMGTGMLLTIPLDRFLSKIPPLIGFAVFFAFFILTKNVAVGRLSFIEGSLPKWLYANYLTAYLGFPPDDFVSQDYVPVIPWIFLFWVGYFIYMCFAKKGWLKHLSVFSNSPLEWLGRHSLEIYMIHQPLIYALLFIFFKLIRL